MAYQSLPTRLNKSFYFCFKMADQSLFRLKCDRHSPRGASASLTKSHYWRRTKDFEVPLKLVSAASLEKWIFFLTFFLG